jgi:hypothetical protein
MLAVSAYGPMTWNKSSKAGNVETVVTGISRAFPSSRVILRQAFILPNERLVHYIRSEIRDDFRFNAHPDCGKESAPNTVKCNAYVTKWGEKVSDAKSSSQEPRHEVG